MAQRMAGIMSALGNLAIVFTCCAAVSGAQTVSGSPTPPISVSGGRIIGVTSPDRKVDTYLGIPFAAPPVGNLRWREPQPVPAFKNLKADHYGASCMQRLDHDRPPYTAEYLTQNQVNEDCLYLNVWAPSNAKAKKLPVLVWIFGGGFTEGSGECPLYEGSNLAESGLVVVTLNYRLGALGFLSLLELTKESSHHASGNYGLLDQTAALKWIQSNIGRFGGDPSQVTIFGQSAGAASIHALLQSPVAKGLFRAGIAMSGSSVELTPTLTRKEGENAGEAYAAERGAKTLKQLRSLPALDFVAVPALASATAPQIRMGPIVDGYFWTESPEDVYAKGHQNDVPVMTGLIAEDYRLGSVSTAAELRAMVNKKYGDMAASFFKLYPFSNDAEAAVVARDSGRDRGRVSTYLWAKSASETSHAPIWIYYFDHAMPYPEHPEFGAFHAGELPYVFRNLKTTNHPFTKFDYELQDIFSGYQKNLAYNLNPNGTGLADWTPFKAGAPEIMEIGEQERPMPLASPQKLAFWQAYFEEFGVKP